MKSIENKETVLPKKGEEKTKYSDLIKSCLDQRKQGGLTYTDIENRLAIGKAIEAPTDFIQIEDANFSYLKELVKSMTWVIAHEDLLKFRDDILSIK